MFLSARVAGDVKISIDLDDKPFRHASEIGKVRPYGMLASELQAGQPMSTEYLPDDPLPRYTGGEDV
jgi:hypothetical protein